MPLAIYTAKTGKNGIFLALKAKRKTPRNRITMRLLSVLPLVRTAGLEPTLYTLKMRLLCGILIFVSLFVSLLIEKLGYFGGGSTYVRLRNMGVNPEHNMIVFPSSDGHCDFWRYAQMVSQGGERMPQAMRSDFR